MALFALFMSVVVAVFACSPVAVCRAHAAAQLDGADAQVADAEAANAEVADAEVRDLAAPVSADAQGLVAQDGALTSAELSDDGVDYGWLYRKGDYWYRVADYPNTEPRSQYAVMATDGECTYMMPDFVAAYGDPPESDAQMHFFNVTQDFYSDGVLVFECVRSFRLDYMVAFGEQNVSWGRGASSIFNSSAGLGAPESYPRIYSVYNGLNGIERDMKLDEVERVILDRSLYYRWGPGYYAAGCPGRHGQEVIYLDRWFEGCTKVQSIEGFQNLDTREVLTMARMFKGCVQLGELDLSGFDTHACSDFEGMFDGCASLRTLKLGDGWTQAGASASNKATFPLDMVCKKDGETKVYRKGDVIPDGAGEYQALGHVSVQLCDFAFADAAAGGTPAYEADFTCDYTGAAIEPLVRVTFNGEQLKQGEDFTVEFSDNVEDGVAHATITGAGDYYGQAVADFRIQDKGVYAVLYDDGTLYLKENHHPMGPQDVASTAKVVMIAPWFDAKASDAGAAIPWAQRAGQVKRVVFDRSFAAFAPQTARGWFQGCVALRSISGLENLNTSALASTENMFSGCTSLESLPLEGVDLSKVKNASSMFQGCTALTRASLEGMNLAKATDVSSMFQGCTALAKASLEGANLSSAQDASGMFQGCRSLGAVSLEGADLAKATNLSSMFQGCTALTSASLSGAKLASAQDMSNLFSGCASLANVSLQNVSAPSVRTLHGAFQGCAKLADVNLAGAGLVVAADLGCAFKGCGALVNLDLTNLAAPSATNAGELFDGCSSLETLTLGDIGSSGTADLSALLNGCPNLKTLATTAAWRNATAASSQLAFAQRTYRVSPSYKRFLAGSSVPAGAGEYRLRDLALQFATVVMSKSSYTCTGKALKPALKVKLGDVVLQNGKDYTLSYKNNVYPGKARITIQGKGTITGGLVVPFKIVARTTKVGDRLVYETDSVRYTLKVTKLNKSGKKVNSVNAELVSVRVKSSKLKTMTIPDQCTIGGVAVNITAVTQKLVGSFSNVTCVAIGSKVVSIGVRAFAKAPKVKKLLVKSARLKSVKNCLRDSKVRRVETRVYLPKSLKTTYKRWFTKQSGKTGVKFVYGFYFVVV